MEFDLEYCPHGSDILSRLRQFYEERSQAIVLATMEVPSRVQAAYLQKYPEGPCPYPDPHERLEYWDALLVERKVIQDDSIPSAFLTEMDQGLFGGMLGGEVRFLRDERGFVSSMVGPFLNDLTELSKLSFSTSSEWFQRYINQLEVFIKGARGEFGVSHLAMIDGLGFVFELVGATKTYVSVHECPALVRQAIDLGFEVNAAVHDVFFETAPLLEGGTCSLPYVWAPGRVVPSSVDPFGMTSVDYFEEWGRDPLERMFGRYDGGVTHIHGNGRHLVEAVCSVKGLKGLRFVDDGDAPKAFGVLEELKRRCGDMPVLCPAPFAKFQEALKTHELIGGVLYKVTEAPDADTANRAMDEVRAYQP